MWKQIKDGLTSMISDVDGDISSKRVITILFATAVLITWASNLFWGLQISQFIYDGLLNINGVGLGTIIAEKFSRRDSSTSN
jgi:hypothetical protein